MDLTTRAAANRDFFNERAEGWMDRCWQAYFSGEDKAVEAKLSRLFEAAGIRPDSRVLDVGAGDGFLVRFLLPLLGENGMVTEVDVAEKMIAENRRRNQDVRVRFLVADASCLETEDRYDAVLAFSCFPHFADHARTLRCLASLLTSGGRLAVCHLKSSAEMNSFHRGAHPDVSNHELPTAPALGRLFREAGLAVTACVDEPGFYLVAGERAG
jgi:demethylmenaquinone methyltransferase/2-methoxy-6-polyprenyl-1,4-benzoquinol methylase